MFEARGLAKDYAERVLDDVDLSVAAGEIHALVGANGAGKSTLCRIVAGLTAASAGSMMLDGQPYAPTHKRAAEERGVQIVQQELNLVPTLSVAENLFLNRLPNRVGFVRSAALRRQAEKALEQVGLADLDPDAPVQSLGVGTQQLVEIAAALARPCRLLLLDEPTAALTGSETELFVREARAADSQGNRSPLRQPPTRRNPAHQRPADASP